MIRRGEAALEKARTRTNLQALAKLTEVVDGRVRIVSQPPVLIPMRELGSYYGLDAAEGEAAVRELFQRYRRTVSQTRRQLLDRYRIVDVARKVVGVGRVGHPSLRRIARGTRRAGPAVPPGQGGHPLGPRGAPAPQRLRQQGGASGPGPEAAPVGLGHLPRLVRRIEGGPLLLLAAAAGHEGIRGRRVDGPPGLNYYAQICGWTLARAHARSGDPIAIAAYLGGERRFDKAIAEFAEQYADQNERDYQAFLTAIRSGRIEARSGV